MNPVLLLFLFFFIQVLGMGMMYCLSIYCINCTVLFNSQESLSEKFHDTVISVRMVRVVDRLWSESRLVLQGREACRAGLATSTSTTFTACHICGQRFHGVYQKYNLKRHISIHMGEKPYLCPRCPTAFNQKCNMKRHLESVHGVKVPSYHALTESQNTSLEMVCSNQHAVVPGSQQMTSPSSLPASSSNSNQPAFSGDPQWPVGGTVRNQLLESLNNQHPLPSTNLTKTDV